jgi:ABC-type transport system involved in Fe-S cluster assembly fused permease/ATPase subunit
LSLNGFWDPIREVLLTHNNFPQATSAVDLESDQAIQQVLAGEQFNGVTRLTIAHRLVCIVTNQNYSGRG